MGQNSSICNCWLLVPSWITAPIYDQQSPTVNWIPSEPSKIFLIEKNIFQKKTWIRKWPLEKWCFEKTTFYTPFPFCWWVLPSPNPSQTCREKKRRRKSCFCQGDIILFLEAGIQVWNPLFEGRVFPKEFWMCFFSVVYWGILVIYLYIYIYNPLILTFDPNKPNGTSKQLVATQICFIFTLHPWEMIQFDGHFLFKWVGSTTS